MPACPPRATQRLAGVADDVVFVVEPEGFEAVGQLYDDFSQTSDEEVVRLLEWAHRANKVGR